MDALREEVVAGALELASVRSRARALRPETRTPGCPYPGLAGFGPADVELFHGRDRLVALALARLSAAPLLALIGDPGAGKTSLLRAGLLPALTAGVLPDSGRWRQVVVTPSTVVPGPGARTLADLLAPPRTPALSADMTRSNPLTTPTALLPFVVPTARTAESPAETSAHRPGQPLAEETVEPDPLDDIPDFAPGPATGLFDVDAEPEVAPGSRSAGRTSVSQRAPRARPGAA